ncbi:putative amidohydrolase [Streptomyces spinoverrucosus]|uniref:Putative amidohydrolase n=1 Tax=Streptomyces spinoverrucosus TaxID=284043 RepID=A0A4Y3VQL3_9ACTN|nr:putative amidohydrolase [Streptomyces spinoverrucosus]GHB89059.1 putative amidohydrolase [Streptomyces spinoverrucosus]
MRPLTVFAMDLHQHPEPSGEESRTASRFADALAEAGYAVTRGVGGHGVVGVLTNGEGPRVYLRAELDALPIRERTGLPYAAQGPFMHACGHDLHLAALLGAATLLARSLPHWRGTVVIVGQPAEETLTGARAMLEDGLYARFGRPDAVLAQHTAPLLGGMVAHGYGQPVLAGSLGLDVTLHGRGGHAGAPHLTVDPVLAAAAVVLRLQGIVSRESAPAEQTTVTVGQIHAGTHNGVVPDSASLGITVRALSDESLDRVVTAVERVVRAESTASGCPRDPEITVVSRSPATLPDGEVTAVVREAHRQVLGAERVVPWAPSMATEDFGLYGDAGQEIHGCAGVPLGYWMVGIVGPRQWSATAGANAAERLAALPPNHSPEFAPHLPIALPSATKAMTSAALTLLSR